MTGELSRAGRDDWAVLFQAGAVGGLTDAELLARFVRGRGDAGAEAAFAALVDRHGPMVLGVCRRVTGDRHAAEDAFQATFLVLARRAGAVRLGPDDSLGRWLYGVGLRVARRAAAAGRRRMTSGLDGVDPIDPTPAADPCERADLRAAIDAEIARLPARYRSAVVLCHLEGLSQEQAARRLRCPVGTVQSRLHRARERLRSGLVRRGLGPAVGGMATWLDGSARAAVPGRLAISTAAAAGRLAGGSATAKVASAAVAGLIGATLRSMMMSELRMIAALVALAASATGGAAALVGGGDGAPGPAPATAPSGPADGGEGGSTRSGPSLAEQLAQIRSEYEAADRALHVLYRGSTIPEENREEAEAIRPDLPATVERIAEVAAAAPADPAVRDAWIWVIRRITGYADAEGPHGAEFDRAGDWLIEHFGDDPDAVRLGLDLARSPTARQDALILRFFAAAEGRESEGLARLALADLLRIKARLADRSREVEGRRTLVLVGVRREDGTIHDEEMEQSDEGYAYLLHLKQCDVDSLEAEAERLYEEVIAEYGDVPYVTTHDRRLEALLREQEPTWNGEPLTEEGRRKIEEAVAGCSTLGKVAADRLDDWFNLAVGKEAPAIEGPTVDGGTLRLAGYRGKVVALVFWGSWCGPCMREVPREKALVERMQGRPFAMLGVNTDADPEDARRAMESAGIDWPNWHDGDPGDGPIARRYHIRSYPTIFVIDAEGAIRSKNASGERLDRLVEELVAEAEADGHAE